MRPEASACICKIALALGAPLPLARGDELAQRPHRRPLVARRALQVRELTAARAIDLARFAKHKVWVKPGGEQSFLYGNHVLKAGLGRITEDTPQYQGVVVLNMADVPLGFGTTAKSTADCRVRKGHLKKLYISISRSWAMAMGRDLNLKSFLKSLKSR